MIDFFVSDNEDNDNEEEEEYCPNCKRVDIFQRLGPRILEEGEVSHKQDEDWKQCPRCGRLYYHGPSLEDLK